ncbi:hypothetical protein B566_EDAN015400 [Ephemera danica]|nr:hypothetical protein B566_EDAN015400 [Ephemera danica]
MEEKASTPASTVKDEPMSSSYADGLSPYDNKGKLGLKEIFDSREEVLQKVSQLAVWIKEAKHVVFHTGAGISTSAGIPDFRGPQGVWTLEAKGLRPTVNISFNNAVPTKTHLALKTLVEKGVVKYVISQNIDGLHLRSGLPRHSMSELHGNMFTEQCNHCERLFVRSTATTSVGQRCLERSCPTSRPGGRPCRGKIHDTILDWEANLPERELCMAEWHSGMADLSITLGTTLQILPSGNLPLLAKKREGKVDKKGDLLIRAYVDEIMEELVSHLGLAIPPFFPDLDPTQRAANSIVEWTITPKVMQLVRRTHTEICKTTPKPPPRKRKKKAEESPIKNEEQNGKSESVCSEKISANTEQGSEQDSKSVIKPEHILGETYLLNNTKNDIPMIDISDSANLNALKQEIDP